MRLSQVTATCIFAGLLMALPLAGAEQLKAEPISTLPTEFARYGACLTKEGVRVTNSGTPVFDVWFRSSLPRVQAVSGEKDVAFPEIPQGALVGVMRVNGSYSDRRGHKVAPGLYSLRYATYPKSEDHYYIAPQRDFLILSRLSDDPGPDATPNAGSVMAMSLKATNTGHVLCLSLGFPQGSDLLEAQDSGDWILRWRLGDQVLGLVVFGVFPG